MVEMKSSSAAFDRLTEQTWHGWAVVIDAPLRPASSRP